MQLVPNSWGVLREFNPCHKPAGQPTGGQFAPKGECGEPGAVRTLRRADKVQRTEWSDWGTKKELWTYDDRTIKGRPLTQTERDEAVLYHITTNLDAVVRSGKLIAQEAGTGLGGGQHPSVSFTTSRAAALNIMRVLVTAKAIATGAPLRETLEAWRKEELARVSERFGGYDNVPMTYIDKSWDGIAAALQSYEVNIAASEREYAAAVKFTPDWGRPKHDQWIADRRANAAMDAFRSYLAYRESAGLGDNPVIFTSGVRMRDAVGEIGIIAVAGRHLPKETLVNFGADKFQAEVEVHGDVPIRMGYYERASTIRQRARRYGRARWGA